MTPSALGGMPEQASGERTVAVSLNCRENTREYDRNLGLARALLPTGDDLHISRFAFCEA
jgi:hypothetical protein